MKLNRRTRKRKAAVLEHKFQMMKIKDMQEQVLKIGRAIDLAVLPVCDPT